jgi:hypothetical protein
MGKYLKLGGDPGAQNWTLPDQTDLEKLRSDIAQAMDDKNFFRVGVVVATNQTAELIVNAGELTAAMVWEDSPSGGGGITIID